MRELFDAVSVIKYQQPDEDLDALVSVVNDDDVVNMMEEYDKLAATPATADGGGGGGGYTRLRIFLFSHHNSDPDAAAAVAAAHFDVDERETERRYVDALNSLAADSVSPSPPPEVQDQFFGPPLRQLNIPHSFARYGEESSWSPAYFSPSSGRDPREFPNSPSAHFDQQPLPMMDNVMWLPPGAMVQEKAGFPGNLGHAHNVFDGGNSICEHCRVGYQRGQAHVSDPRYLDSRWNQGGGGNEYMGHFAGSCAECYRNREPPFYNEAHGHDYGYLVHPHQAPHRVEDPRMHLGAGSRMGDHYVVDGNAMNVPFGHGNFYDGHDDGRYLRPPPGNEFGTEVFHAQQGVGHVNLPSQYAVDNPYQVPPNLPPIQNMRRRAQVPIPYDPAGMMIQNGFVRSTQDGSPRLPWIGVDDQIQGPWNGQNGSLPKKYFGVDEHGARLTPNVVNQDERILVAPDLSFGMRVNEVKEENLDMKEAKPTEAENVGDFNPNVDNKESPVYLPELIASFKKTTLGSAVEIKARAEDNPEVKKEPSSNEIGTGVRKDSNRSIDWLTCAY